MPTITNIINTALITGLVPHDLKIAIFKPLLKKPPLDKNFFEKLPPHF